MASARIQINDATAAKVASDPFLAQTIPHQTFKHRPQRSTLGDPRGVESAHGAEGVPFKKTGNNCISNSNVAPFVRAPKAEASDFLGRPMLAAMQAPGPSYILPEFQPPQLYQRPSFGDDVKLPSFNLLRTAPPAQPASQLMSVAPVGRTNTCTQPAATLDDRSAPPQLTGLVSLAALASSQREVVNEEQTRQAKVDHGF